VERWSSDSKPPIEYQWPSDHRELLGTQSHTLNTVSNSSVNRGTMLVRDTPVALSDDRKWRHRSTRPRDRRETGVVRSNAAGEAMHQRSVRRVAGLPRRRDRLPTFSMQRPQQLYPTGRHHGLGHPAVSQGLQVLPGNHLRVHPRYVWHCEVVGN